LATFFVATGLAADLVGDFGAEAVPVDLVVTAREPTLAVLAALADLAVALAELLAGAAFFTAVTSTSSQGVVGPALVGASTQAGLP
jgi:hypothetical protein